jgi:RHS repeat-associated protein
MLSTQVQSGADTLHHLRYTNYDAYGNVITQRNDAPDVNASETFIYDKLHRLTRSSLTTSGFTGAIDYGYDAVGNLMRKTDYSTSSNNAYTYKANTNQLQQVALKDGGSTHFGYDTKGNLTRRGSASNALTTENTYNVFNKPTRISRLGSTVNLDYGADLMRYKQVRTVNNETITTYYIDKVFEVELSGSGADAVREETTYLGDMAILIETTNQSDGSAIDNKIRFTHKDRLGSSATFTDHNAQVTTRRSYDPFGAPKGGDWAPLSSLNMAARLYNNGQDSDMPTRRGYTDHEHLDEVEIIHMNGRVYDYNVGRFLSVDPVIVDPTNTQAINPYSYVMNNPLAYTDPSGYAPIEIVVTCASNRPCDRDPDVGKQDGATSDRNREESSGGDSGSGNPSSGGTGDNGSSNGSEGSGGRGGSGPDSSTDIGSLSVISKAGGDNPERFNNRSPSTSRFESFNNSLAGLGDKISDVSPIAGFAYDFFASDFVDTYINVTKGDYVAASVTLLFALAKPLKVANKLFGSRSTKDLIQSVATRAERRIGGRGAAAGSRKHAYAKRLLDRYQRRYGGNLETEVSYIRGQRARYGQKGSTRLDVYDPITGDVYDFKFVKTPGRGISQRQQSKIRGHGPAGIVDIIEVNP